MTTKAERAKLLRYKRPALASLAFFSIQNELDEIAEKCSEIQWFINTDDDTLMSALDGDDEEAYEFRMAFSDLSSKAEQLNEAIQDGNVSEYFDDCIVGLIGNRYNTLGYDSEEEDYFALTGYEQDLAYAEAGKRLARLTKPEMLSKIGQCLGIVIAFLDLRQSYDYLKATFDILRDENVSMLQAVKDIEAAYENAAIAKFLPDRQETKQLNALVRSLPAQTWVE